MANHPKEGECRTLEQVFHNGKWTDQGAYLVSTDLDEDTPHDGIMRIRDSEVQVRRNGVWGKPLEGDQLTDPMGSTSVFRNGAWGPPITGDKRERNGVEEYYYGGKWREARDGDTRITEDGHIDLYLHGEWELFVTETVDYAIGQSTAHWAHKNDRWYQVALTQSNGNKVSLPISGY